MNWLTPDRLQDLFHFMAFGLYVIGAYYLEELVYGDG